MKPEVWNELQIQETTWNRLSKDVKDQYSLPNGKNF